MKQIFYIIKGSSVTIPLSGNYEFKKLHDNYGDNLEATLCNYPIKELSDFFERKEHKKETSANSEQLQKQMDSKKLEKQNKSLNQKERKIKM